MSPPCHICHSMSQHVGMSFTQLCICVQPTRQRAFHSLLRGLSDQIVARPCVRNSLPMSSELLMATALLCIWTMKTFWMVHLVYPLLVSCLPAAKNWERMSTIITAKIQSSPCTLVMMDVTPETGSGVQEIGEIRQHEFCCRCQFPKSSTKHIF